MTITCDKHTFNFLRKEGFTFLVVADEAYGRQIPFALLERVSEDFLNTRATKAKAAAPAPHSMDRTFGPKLKQHMVRAFVMRHQQLPAHKFACAGPSTRLSKHIRPSQCRLKLCFQAAVTVCGSLYLQDYCTNNPDEISRIAACQKKVDDVKNIMVENIDKVRWTCSRTAPEVMVEETATQQLACSWQMCNFHETGSILSGQVGLQSRQDTACHMPAHAVM
jgi:hypothetical protein